MTTLTIAQLMKWKPCYSRQQIGDVTNGRDQLTAEEILDLDIPVEDRLWVLLRSHFFSDRDLKMMAAVFAELVLPLFEKLHPDDLRPRKAIEAARLYAMGEVDQDELRAAAADAADAAAADAAWAAAAAADAARAAWAAAWAAAWDADAAWAADANAAAAYAAADAAWAANAAAADAAWAAAAAADAARAAWAAAWDADAANKTVIDDEIIKIVRIYLDVWAQREYI